MLPDLGRLIRLLYLTVAATVALRVVLGRWRPTLVAVGGAGALVLVAGRLLRQRRPVAPDDWPAPGRPTLAVATGDGVWRVELGNGRAFPASSTGEPTAGVRFDGRRLRASAPLAWRETTDWRTWTLGWPPAGSITWRLPRVPPPASAAGLPRRGDRVLALMPDGVGGQYVGTGPWPAALAMGAYLAAPSSRLSGLPRWLLERRRGRLYHLDASGTRRLIAAGLPPVFAIARVPSEGALAGPPAPIEIRPIPSGPEPSIAGADAATS
jgi:hypothetical protein